MSRRIVIRPTRLSRGAYGGLLVLAAIVMAAVTNGTGAGGLLRALGCVGIAVAVVLLVRILRAGALVVPGGLLVRAYFKTDSYAWDRVDAVEVGKPNWYAEPLGGGVTVHLIVRGQRHRLNSLGRLDTQRGREEIEHFAKQLRQLTRTPVVR